MNRPTGRLLEAILIAAVIGLVTYGYRDYRRGAFSRYLQSHQFSVLADLLPKPTEEDRRASISVTENQVTVQVDVRTQEEFDRLVQASRRAGRPRVERLQLVWKGVQYEL